jgi:hypothetical protein
MLSFPSASLGSGNAPPLAGFRNGDSRLLILAEVHDGNITAQYEYLQELAVGKASNCVGDE